MCRHSRKLKTANDSKIEKNKRLNLRLKQLQKREYAKTPRGEHHLRSLCVIQVYHPLFALQIVLYDCCYSENNEKPQRHEDGVDM